MSEPYINGIDGGGDNDGSNDDGDSLGDSYTVGGDGEEDEEGDRDMRGYPPSSSRKHQRLESLRMRVQAVRHMLLLYLPPTTTNHHHHDNNNSMGGGSVTHTDKGSFSITPTPTSSSLPPHNAPSNPPNSLFSSFAAMAGSWLLGAHFSSYSAYQKQVNPYPF